MSEKRKQERKPIEWNASMVKCWFGCIYVLTLKWGGRDTNMFIADRRYSGSSSIRYVKLSAAKIPIIKFRIRILVVRSGDDKTRRAWERKRSSFWFSNQTAVDKKDFDPFFPASEYWLTSASWYPSECSRRRLEWEAAAEFATVRIALRVILAGLAKCKLY